MILVTENMAANEKFELALDRLLASHAKQEQLLEARDRRIAELEAQLAAALSGDEFEPTSSVVMSYSFEDFEIAAKAKMNISVGWQVEFEKQTGTSHQTFQQWVSTGLVTQDVMDLVDGLTVAAAPKKKETLTIPQLERIAKLYVESKTTMPGLGYKERTTRIAQIMDKDFPERSFTATVIEGAISNYKLASGKPVFKPGSKKALEAAQAQGSLH